MENRRMSIYYVYILASRKKGALYVGMAKDLDRRIFEHKNEIFDGFTRKYKIKKLVYDEKCEDKKTAGMRERQLKRWRRAWKIELVEKHNSDWKDLYSDLNSTIAE